MTGVDVAAIRERCMNDWLRGRGKDLTQAETDRADMVAEFDEALAAHVAGEWVRFYFDDADPVAECPCGWHAHGDSATDAFRAWWEHRRVRHAD